MIRSCARISQVLRLRMPPSRPVAQKSHASAHPTCELRQTVYLAVGSASSAAACPARRRSLSARAASGAGSGMRTASISRPSGSLKRYFKKPSSARRRSSTSRSGHVQAASSAAAAGRDSPRTDSGGNPGAPSRCTRAKIRPATSAPIPKRATAAASSARSRLRRFSGSGAASDCTTAITVAHCSVPMPHAYTRSLDGSRRIKLDAVDAADTQGLEKDDGLARLEKLGRELSELENLLTYAGTHALLVVLQGRDASGKDGTIRKILEYTNVQQAYVHAFKVPTEEESAHDFPWRAHKAIPRRGYMALFNRSYYEDVLAARA